MLDTENHVVGERLEQVRLVFKVEILVGVAAVNGQSIQSPVDF